MTSPGLLADLERYYDTAPRAACDTEELGPLTLFLPRSGFPYYARPRLGLAGEVTAADVTAVLARQRELDVPRAVEWVHDTTPSLLAAAREAGMTVEECPLLVLEQEPPEPDPAAGVRIVAADDPELGLVRAAINVGFGTPGTSIGEASVAERDADARAHPETAERIAALITAGLGILAGAFDARGRAGRRWQPQPARRRHRDRRGRRPPGLPPARAGRGDHRAAGAARARPRRPDGVLLRPGRRGRPRLRVGRLPAGGDRLRRRGRLTRAVAGAVRARDRPRPLRRRLATDGLGQDHGGPGRDDGPRPPPRRSPCRLAAWSSSARSARPAARSGGRGSRPPGGGPVAAVAAGLSLVETDLVVVLAGDMPFAADTAGTPGRRPARRPDDRRRGRRRRRRTRRTRCSPHTGPRPCASALPDPPADARRPLAAGRSRTRPCPSTRRTLSTSTPPRRSQPPAIGSRREGDHPPRARRTRRPRPRRRARPRCPGPARCVVEVVAAGVNRADVMQRQGHYDPPPGASAYPGLEVSGRIAQLGDGVDGWSVGDEVCALLDRRGLRRAGRRAGRAAPPGPGRGQPRGRRGAAGGRLHRLVQRLHDRQHPARRGPARPRRRLRDRHHGRSSWPARSGARVAVTAGSPEKLEVCRELGADDPRQLPRRRTSSRRRPRGHRRARRRRHPRQHGREVPRPQRRAARRSTAGWSSSGCRAGARAELDLGAMLAKRCALVIATSLRARPAAEKAAIVAAVREHVWPLIEAGRVRPSSTRAYPLGDAAGRPPRDGGVDPRRQAPAAGLNCPETLGYVAKIPPETIPTDYPGPLREYR